MRHARIHHTCACELSRQRWGLTLLCLKIPARSFLLTYYWWCSVFLTHPWLVVLGVSYSPIAGGPRCFLLAHCWWCSVFLTRPLLVVLGVSYSPITGGARCFSCTLKRPPWNSVEKSQKQTLWFFPRLKISKLSPFTCAANFKRSIMYTLYVMYLTKITHCLNPIKYKLTEICKYECLKLFDLSWPQNVIKVAEMEWRSRAQWLSSFWQYPHLAPTDQCPQTFRINFHTVWWQDCHWGLLNYLGTVSHDLQISRLCLQNVVVEEFRGDDKTVSRRNGRWCSYRRRHNSFEIGNSSSPV